MVTFGLRVLPKNSSPTTRLALFWLTRVQGTSLRYLAFGNAPEIFEDSSSQQCLSLIKNWLRDCEQCHASCARQTLPKLPTRVVDVQEPSRLYETNHESSRYVALSHCWGKVSLYRTKKATLGVHKKGIGWDDLFKTLQDAIALTRQLEIPYIWIDSLCIVQDDTLDCEHPIVT